ncbi:hypothetical protein [Methylocella silvestris]|uniref:hypothetical protein n=1 Tax=Methylocella silvestris TaxID=199596 RepID=UPI00059DF92A|nr:hypothetical protein [Methylocella silvestris]
MFLALQPVAILAKFRGINLRSWSNRILELWDVCLGLAERLSFAGTDQPYFTHCVSGEDDDISTLTAALHERKGNPCLRETSRFRLKRQALLQK